MSDLEEQAQKLWGWLRFLHRRDGLNKIVAVRAITQLARHGHPIIQKRAEQALKELKDDEPIARY